MSKFPNTWPRLNQTIVCWDYLQPWAVESKRLLWRNRRGHLTYFLVYHRLRARPLVRVLFLWECKHLHSCLQTSKHESLFARVFISCWHLIRIHFLLTTLPLKDTDAEFRHILCVTRRCIRSVKLRPKFVPLSVAGVGVIPTPVFPNYDFSQLLYGFGCWPFCADLKLI